MSIGWRDIKVDGKPASFVDIEGKRLYISQRNDEAFSAFVDGEKVGLHYPTVSAAQAAALTAIGIKPPPDPFRYSPTQRESSAPRPRIDKREELLKMYPIADMSDPVKVVAVPVELEPPLPSEPKPEPPRIEHFELSVMAHMAMAGLCTCGVRLGRSGKCPALCQPIEKDPPLYTGPTKVGRTHTARLGAPVSW